MNGIGFKNGKSIKNGMSINNKENIKNGKRISNNENSKNKKNIKSKKAIKNEKTIKNKKAIKNEKSIKNENIVKNGKISQERITKETENREKRQELEKDQVKSFILYEAAFEKVKSNIFFEVIDYKSNKKALQQVPYHRFHHLALRYHFIVERTEDQGDFIKTFPITNSLLRIWRISKEELYRQARKNMKRLFTPIIRDTEQITFRYLSMILDDKRIDALCKNLGELPIYHRFQPGSFHQYTITSQYGNYGAGAMLYQGFLRKNIEQFHLERHFLYLLPVCKNEVVLFASVIPLRTKELRLTAKNMYDNVPESKRLSKSVYQYDVCRKKFYLRNA